MKINETQLRALIKEAIEKKLKKENKKPQQPKLRDDVGSFFAVFKPNGGEGVDELMCETNVLEYGSKVGNRQPHAIVRSESRARRLATELRQGKINEFASAKQKEIDAKLAEIKETNALMGALTQYHKLKESNPKGNQHLKKYESILSKQNKELAELKKQKMDIEEGKIVKVPQPSSTAPASETNNEEDVIDLELKERQFLKVPQPSSGNSQAHITHNEEDVKNPQLKENKKKKLVPKKAKK